MSTMLALLTSGCFWTGPVPADELFTDPDALFETPGAPTGDSGDAPVGGNDVAIEVFPAAVIATMPIAGAIDVDPSRTELEVTFSGSMFVDGSSVSDVGGVPVEVTSIASDRFRIETTLEPARAYRIWLNDPDREVTGFRDTEGSVIEPFSLAFSTKGGPMDPYAGLEGAVLRTEPVSGTQLVDPSLTPLTIEFTKPIDLATVTLTPLRAETALPDSVPALDDPTTLTLSVTLEASTTYGVMVDATDTEGIAFPSYVLTFRTRGG